MATENETIQVSIRKEPEQMSAEEIVYELKGLTLAGSRSWSLITQLDKLYNQKCRRVESKEAELGIVNEELKLLRQAQKGPVQTFRVYQGETPDGAIPISEFDQIIAYCAGMSEGIKNILHYIEHTVNFENCEMV